MRVGLYIKNAPRALLFALLLGPPGISAQQIHYSVPLDNIRSTSFDIIGRCKGQLLIYKKSYNDHVIEKYDQKMKLLNKVPLDFLPAEVKQVDFINLHDKVWMIYQYTKRRDIYCQAAKLGPNGLLLPKPLMIDKTTHPYQVVGNKAYATISSKDKSQIMIFEILRNDDSLLFHIRTFLFDSAMTLLHKGTVSLPYSDPEDRLQQCTLSDQGGFYFLYGSQAYSLDPYYRQLWLYYKPAMQNKLLSAAIPFEGHLPDTKMLMKADDEQNRLWVNTFNYGPKSRNINYLSTFQFDLDSLALLHKAINPLNDSLRQALRGKKDNVRRLFDNYALKDMIINKNEGALVIAEKSYQDVDNQTHYGDLGLFDLDSAGNLIQVQKVDKDQGPDLPGTFDSYLTINTGHALHFLMNKSHRVFRFLNNRIYLLRDYRYDAQHRLKVMRVMRGLDNKYQWAPRYGMQISRNEVVIPCVEGGSLLFAEIVY